MPQDAHRGALHWSRLPGGWPGGRANEPIQDRNVSAAIRRISQELGIGGMLVEQNVNVALNLASRAYVLSRGALALSGSAEELRGSDHVRKAYLGMGS